MAERRWRYDDFGDGSLEVHDTLLKIAEGAFTKSEDKYRALAAVVLRSYKYGVIMGKRMERARRKQ